MKITSSYKWILVALLGAATGAAAMHAQDKKVAAGYVVAQIEVTDPGKFQEYLQKVPPIVAKYGGHFMIRGGAITPVEGEAPKRLTVVAFDSLASAKAYEFSPEYEAVRPIRQGSAKSTVFIVEGVNP